MKVLIYGGLCITLVIGWSLFSVGQEVLIHCPTSFTIPAALEMGFVDTAAAFTVKALPDQPVIAKLVLRVGTNDWPLKLHLGLVEPNNVQPSTFVFYQFVKGTELGILWLSIPVFSETVWIAELPDPGWTEYTLAIRVNPLSDVSPGCYVWKLRILLRSNSGLEKKCDIPIEITVP
ncbi:MAG: hypothetical protein QXQ66_10045 [Candidatus Hadarchaeum sp.]|uniref:hypothetical protein n=1 Tax=Candidatus Hadarchaeum sp. TaxID=2883567 RepID=UPI0031773C15